MDLIHQLHSLAKLIGKNKGNITAPEAAKRELVMPFIQALGYDVFDPTEVCPQFTVEVAGKTDEKVDYAILIDNKPALLCQCTSCNSAPNDTRAAQLRKCFHAASARIGILTNGKVYSFYADFEEEKVMDAQPFLQFNLENIDAPAITELRKLAKPSFRPDKAYTTAKELTYIRLMKNILLAECSSPSLELIRFCAGQVYAGRLTDQALDQFAPIVQEAFTQLIDDSVNDRLLSEANRQREKGAEDIHGTQYEQAMSSDQDLFISAEEFEKFFVVDIT